MASGHAVESPPHSFGFEARPETYKHWQLRVDPPLAYLTLSVLEDAPLLPGYKLKLNSYDLGVDIELADAVQRLRFSHPEVRAVVLSSASERVFSAGANIHMLASAAHGFKVNFCKYTNETRLAMEDASASSGQRYLAACNGATAGGGYELALACDRILLVDDGHAAVSLPEASLLGVLPGTGGLTRVVDKRKVRRDLADVFCTLPEGVKGRRAVEWNLVDEVVPRSRFREIVRERALALAGRQTRPKGPGIELEPLSPEIEPARVRYRHLTLSLDRAARTAELLIEAPAEPVRLFREIDDALLRLRFHYEDTGVVLIKTRGTLDAVRAGDEDLYSRRDGWLAHETLLLMRRVLRRLDTTAKTFFAVIDEGSCFAGSLFELALAADRIYMLAAREARLGEARLALTPLNAGALEMWNGLSRLEQRFLRNPEYVKNLLEHTDPLDAQDAADLGLITAAVDDIDWEEELRLAVEERSSLSPDALTGLEASLRFAGPETPATKVFGRLSAWQNWVFSRPNAVGEHGALRLYGQPGRPQFDWRRT
jgi:benzoyl-CoA-dihydrodiol lyase